MIIYKFWDQSSFQSVGKWIEYVKDERGEDAIIVLIGNKSDASDKRLVKDI